MPTTVHQPLSTCLSRRMPNDSVQRRVLLGVTGSVAAVKAPEIALKILNLHHQRVALKILLTHGGRHFWDQAKIYNKEIWQKFEAVLSEESQKEEPRLILIGTFYSVYIKQCQ